jgi:hypothetical protein
MEPAQIEQFSNRTLIERIGRILRIKVEKANSESVKICSISGIRVLLLAGSKLLA